ncbi:MAG TPA: IS21 family transposase [Candidatus Dormibacteraeota bacterium]|nr:IS21 family transposase [Candidatus Dormibacteraeota bacterium]
MLEQGIRQAILELHRRGQSVRAIARAVRVSRAAVRDILRRGSAEVPRLERPEKAFEHREDIVRLLRECEGSFTRVHEELTTLGLQLSYPALTAFCRRHGIGHVPKQPVGRYDFAPGQEMQHDTSPHDLHLGGKVRRVQTASLVLGYSRMLFFQFYPQFRRFECKVFLTDALRYLDGACRTCMIDNTHVVVLKGTGRDMIPVPEMAAFAERFGFTFVAHALGDANRSGRVERMFRFIERGFLAGRRFPDWADANRQARAWCDRVNARPKRQLKATPRELFATEHPALRRLPRWVPEPYLIHQRLVDVEGYITLNTNHYSVPSAFIGRRLDVRETQDRVVISEGPREITVHEREVEPRHRYLFRPEHRPPRGQGGRGQDREPFPEEKALLRLLPEIEAYLGGLKRRGKLQTTLALRQLLRMAREYPREPVLAALQTAAHYGLYDLDRLERMVLRGIATTYFQLPLAADGDPADEPTDGRAPAAPQEPAPEPDGHGPA